MWTIGAEKELPGNEVLEALPEVQESHQRWARSRKEGWRVRVRKPPRAVQGWPCFVVILVGFAEIPVANRRFGWHLEGAVGLVSTKDAGSQGLMASSRSVLFSQVSSLLGNHLVDSIPFYVVCHTHVVYVLQKRPVSSLPSSCGVTKSPSGTSGRIYSSTAKRRRSRLRRRRRNRVLPRSWPMRSRRATRQISLPIPSKWYIASQNWCAVTYLGVHMSP